jgi:hypothetical protein
LVGRLSGIRTQSGQTKINDQLTAYKLSPNWEECGPCPVFASYTLAFALQLRKKHGKTSVRVEKTLTRLKNLSQGRKNLSQGRKIIVGVEKASVKVEKTSVRVEKPQSG